MNIETAIKATKPMPFETKTVINILYTSRFIEEHIQAILKRFDPTLTAPQYNVLRILQGQEGKPVNLATVQERMIDKNSNTTRLIDKLVSKKYVKSCICKTNRRKIELSITLNGQTILAKILPELDAFNKAITKKFTNNTFIEFNDTLDNLRNYERTP